MYIFLSVLYASMIVCGQDVFSNNFFVTNNGEWSIFSPFIKKDDSRTLRLHQGTLSTLKSFGEQANLIWASTGQKSEVGAKLHEVFDAVDRNFLINIIDDILSNDDLLESVRLASYRNITGFLKIVLIDGGKDSWKIRLHVWESKEEREFPHNHKWDFYSKILSGYLLQELYEFCDEEDASSRLYSVREPVSLMPVGPSGELPCPCRDNYVLSPKCSIGNSVSLRIKSKDIIGIGESYFMPNYLVHSIIPGRGAISLVFTSEKVNENSEVFVPLDTAQESLTKFAPSITKQELVKELLRVRKILGQLFIKNSYLPEVVDIQHRYYSTKEDFACNARWRDNIDKNINEKFVIQLPYESRSNYILSSSNLYGSGKISINGKQIESKSEYLFVLSDGVMYAALKDFHHVSNKFVCHTSFTDYGPVDCVGVLHFNEKGDLCMLEAYSGHYEPTISDLKVAKEYLHSIGIDVKNVSLVSYVDRIN